MTSRASNRSLAIALGLAAFAVWVTYVLAHLLVSG